MTAFVIDSSVALAWCFEDEVDRYSDSVLEQLKRMDALVPAIWPFEIANVLLVAERRGRQTAGRTDEFTRLLRTLPITIEQAGTAVLWGSALITGRDHALSSYDAAYLELAQRRQIPLASKDKGLRAAAVDSGVTLLPGPPE